MQAPCEPPVAADCSWPGPNIRLAKLTGRFMRFADTGLYAVDRRLVR